MPLCIPTTMHELFTQVLSKKDLSKAGDLFSVADQLIVNDLTEVVNKIREISSLPDYLNNDNDQSVVEICITRVTSAIRETGSIEQHSQALVALLESCLSHDLKPSNRDEDPPHAKIASDVISCIFLNYSKRQVMKLALPIAVKFLHKGNKEVSRNMSSYLSLAAIGNADLLAEHIQPIIDSVISGNYSLSRVLPQIYAVNKEPIHDHVMALVSLLPLCEIPEKLALLTLFGLIAKNKPSLLDSSLSQLCECLTTAGTAASTLQIFLDMSVVRPQPLIEHLAKMKLVADLQPNTLCLACQVISSVSKLSKEKSQDALEYILGELGRVDHASQAVLLKEVASSCASYPLLLSEKVINEISKYSDSTSSGARMLVQQLKTEFVSRNCNAQVNQTSGRVTIVKVGGGESKSDLPSLLPRGASGSSSSSIARQEVNSSSSNSNRPDIIVGASQQPSRILGSSRQRLVATSAGRLGSSIHVNRSMTRLNAHSSGGSRLGSSAGLHKSMTRLNSNQQINLGLVPSALSVNQSIGSRGNVHGGTRVSSGNVTVTTTLGTVNPNKSTSFLTTSSGSMSALREERDVTLVSITTTFPHHPQVIPTSQVARDSVLPVPAGMSMGMGNFLPLNQSGGRLHFPGSSSLQQSGTVVMPPSLSHSGTTLPLSQSGTTSPLSQSGTAISTSSSPLNHLLVCPPPASLSLSHPNNSSNNNQPLTLPAILPLTQQQATTTSGVTYTRRTNTSVTVISNSQQQTASSAGTQRISVFEPYPMRDTVQHFCEKHLDKIKSYMEKILVKIPLPAKCTIEERKSRKHAKLHFACQGRGEHCLYNKTFFAMKTRNPRIWIHLMFLAQQARSNSALSTRETSVSSLKNCWDILKFENKTFLTLVTSAFPSAKDQDMLLQELRNNGFFDVFEYNGPRKQWGCFLCNHPDRALGFLQDTEPVIEGQLKEKKGKWKIFKRWRTRYFTLSGVHLSCRGTNDKDLTPIEVTQIRSVKVTRGGRNIPKAFEIFTSDKSFVLKAKDGKNAEEWVQCLSIVVAHSHAKEVPSKTASLQSHVGSLKTAV